MINLLHNRTSLLSLMAYIVQMIDVYQATSTNLVVNNAMMLSSVGYFFVPW